MRDLLDPLVRRRWPWFVLAVGWVSLCWAASSQTPSDLPKGLPGPTGNLLHIAGNAIFALLLLRSLSVGSKLWSAEAWPGFSSGTGFRVLLIVGIHALFDEAHQYFVPGRSCSTSDLVLDVGGAAAFLLFPLAGGEGRARTIWPSFLLVAALVSLAVAATLGRPFGDRLLEQLLDAITG